MILDSQCNTVFLSGRLQKSAPVTFGNLTEILRQWDVPYSLLPDTKDIWCRDYMPLQVEKGRFFSYNYNPDYLRNYKTYRKSITDSEAVLDSLDLDGIFTNLPGNLVLDGGNVVRCGSKVVMTAKIFEENPSYRPVQILEALEEMFEAEVIVIPWDTKEIFGHADGVCRYADDDTIVLTDYRQIDKKMGARFYECLKPHFRNIVELEYTAAARHKFDWAYINWLQTDKVLIVPSFGCAADAEAIRQIEAALPSYRGRIVTCECPEVVRKGGALNCCSWTITR